MSTKKAPKKSRPPKAAPPLPIVGFAPEEPALPPPPKVWDVERAKVKKGRPMIFEERPEAWPRLVWALRQGNTFDAAAGYAGIYRGTFTNLLKRGRQAQKDNEPGPWLDFISIIDECLAFAEVRHVGNIAFAATDPRHWKASAFLLASRNPKKWAPAQRVAHTKADFVEDAVFEMVLPNTRPSAVAPVDQARPAQESDDPDDLADDEGE